MPATAHALTHGDKHYLEAELDDLIHQNDVWQFLRAGSLDGVWYWDLENPANEWMSPELWDLLGIDPATKAHDPAEWQNLIHPDDLKAAIANFEAHCADPDHPYDQIVRYKHADGSTVWVRCRGLAIRRPDGTPYRMLGAHNDVTALKQAEESARRERALTDHANEDLQAFAYSTSHDLKSPANTIRMLLKELRLALQSGDYADAELLLGQAEVTNDSMRSLVDKLLEYTRVVGRSHEAEPVDLDTLLQEVLTNLTGDIREAGADVIVEPLGTVHGSGWQLRQLFQNLISNAIKFQPEGRKPEIAVFARPDRPGWRRIEVSDNGIGISAEDQERIFGLFSKLHRASSFDGTGLGLAFCHRVAGAHGSEVKVRSIEGRGAVFSISLPIEEGQQ